MSAERWTVGKLLEWTQPFFQKHGIDSARLDAEVLLAHTLKIRRLDLYTGYDKPLTATELDTYRAYVKRRAQREPVAYLVGSKGFYDIDLHVDKRVLIPRPDTEVLVEAALEHLPSGGRFLDLCTGSGAIALAILHSSQDTTGLATDVSKEALDVARLNTDKLQMTARLELRLGDLFKAVSDETFDLIASNPPYVAKDAPLSPDVAHYEPKLALFAENEGMAIIERILREAPRHLNETGRVMLEIGFDQRQKVEELAQHLGYQEVRFHRDLGGVDRVFDALRG